VQIWVDADACPKVIKDILYRAAGRWELSLTLVANQPLTVPPSTRIKAIQVAGGFDVADDYIAKSATAGDIVITADIPLAAEVIASGAAVISPRGERFTKDNIGPKLNMRDFMDTMRSSGAMTGGPPPMNQHDRQRFANELDRLLAKGAKRAS
jgi:uncharacterized protein YaiI (UPF0178 family)